MATQTEKLINDLAIEFATLNARVENLSDEVDPLPELSKKVAVLEAQIAELTKAKDLWGQRGWAVLTVVMSAVFSLLSALLAVTLAYYLNSKR